MSKRGNRTKKTTKKPIRKYVKKISSNKKSNNRKTNNRKTGNKKTNSKKTTRKGTVKNNFQKIVNTLEKREKTLQNCIKNRCDNKNDLSEFQKSVCYHQKCEKEIEKYKQQKKEYMIANQVINKSNQGHYLNHMKHILYMEEAEISVDNIIHQIKDDCRLDKSIVKMLIHFAKLPYTKKKERIDSLERLEKESIV